MTADHVIADTRVQGTMTRTRGETIEASLPAHVGLVALHGCGLVYGAVGLPSDAFRLIDKIWSPALPGNDPLAQLRGRPQYLPIDLAFLTTPAPSKRATRNLLLRSHPPRPKIGDLVVTVGFPRIDTFIGSDEAARTTISEGMMAAYGRVVDLHIDGRDLSNPTPLFEVEANWPSGMSGGPVFNAFGEVIGLVSRSIEPQEAGGLGTGWATMLQAFPGLASWAPEDGMAKLSRENCS